MSNINVTTIEQVGEKFIEWLKLERKHMALREEMYYADFYEYESDNDEVCKPSDKSELLAMVRMFHDSLKDQQEAYRELLEVSDLYITKELL